MSKRYNSVTLDGVLTVHEVDTIILDNVPTITLECTCNTNEPGGTHRVFAYARQAAETMAFAAIADLDQIPLEATIRGYLWSGNGNSATVAEEVVFHVARNTRLDAVSLLKQLLTDRGSTQFIIRGRNVPIDDLLKLVLKPGPGHNNKPGGKLKAVHINVSDHP